MPRLQERAPAGPLSSGTIRRHVLFGAAITALGGLLFGYDTGVISGALLFIGKDFPGLTSFDKELLTSILLIGALIGALAAGRIADKVGRRPTVLGTAALFVAGVMLAAFSPSYGVLVAARVIIGLAVGSASMVVPLYIGEVVPPRIRGALVSFNQLAITSGILVSYLVDYGLASSQNWRLMFGLAAIPAILMFTGMLFQHESPHWLVAQGREDEARAVLRRVRDEGDIDAEIAEVRELSGRTLQLPRGAEPGGAPCHDHRCRAGRVPADHRDQHDHLLRADPAGIGRSRQLGGAAGQRRQRRRERLDDDRRDPAPGPHRPPPAAARRHHGDGGRDDRGRPDLPHRRQPSARRAPPTSRSPGC